MNCEGRCRKTGKHVFFYLGLVLLQPFLFLRRHSSLFRDLPFAFDSSQLRCRMKFMSVVGIRRRDRLTDDGHPLFPVGAPAEVS